MTNTTEHNLEGLRVLVTEMATLLGQMESLLAIQHGPDAADDLMPVQWFTRETYVTGRQLRGARLRGLIRCERRGSRWYYSRLQAHRLFPDRWGHGNVAPLRQG